jgi:hypothetical protein
MVKGLTSPPMSKGIEGNYSSTAKDLASDLENYSQSENESFQICKTTYLQVECRAQLVWHLPCLRFLCQEYHIAQLITQQVKFYLLFLQVTRGSYNQDNNNTIS